VVRSHNGENHSKDEFSTGVFPAITCTLGAYITTPFAARGSVLRDDMTILYQISLCLSQTLTTHLLVQFLSTHSE
jgi:hypothetical protein